MNKYLVVGLGNPEQKYDNTRHNIGYMFVDNLLKQINDKTGENNTFKSDRYAYVSQVKIMGRPTIIIKPTTYMNLSGKAVRYWLNTAKIPIENMFVIVDDLALPLGELRLRLKGSDGGHNGLKNIIETLQTTTFNRLRFGIGNNFSKGDQVDFVLGQFSEEEHLVIDAQLNKSYQIIQTFVVAGMQKTMNMYNNKA